MSLSLQYLSTPLYDIALDLAQQHSDDFETQEQFIEGVLLAYTIIASAREEAE